MRFFDTSKELLSIREIELGLKDRDASFRIEVPSKEKAPAGLLFRGDDVYGELDINQSGDGLFDEEIKEMLEFLEENSNENRKRVEDTLKSAKRTVSLRVLHQNRDPNKTFEVLDNLWKLLFGIRAGLLQADGEGYYDENGLILEEGW